MEEEKKDEQKKFLSLQPRGNGLPIKVVCGERGRREGGGGKEEGERGGNGKKMGGGCVRQKQVPRRRRRTSAGRPEQKPGQ